MRNSFDSLLHTMSASNIFLRTFTVGAVWFIAVAIKMVSRHPGHWSSYPPRNLIVPLIACVITATLLGLAAKRFEQLRSWWSIGIGMLFGLLLVAWSMLLAVERVYGPTTPPNFKSTDEMMAYLGKETTKWVKQDRNIDLDYSLDSVQVIEQELARISKEVNKTNPQPGTTGIAMGYGAYIGEVFRRRDGGAWAVDDPTVGPKSYPLTTRSNSVIYPVGWCWKRLINGEEDNVYHKALSVTEVGNIVTNNVGAK